MKLTSHWHGNSKGISSDHQKIQIYVERKIEIWILTRYYHSVLRDIFFNHQEEFEVSSFLNEEVEAYTGRKFQASNSNLDFNQGSMFYSLHDVASVKINWDNTRLSAKINNIF